MKVLFLGSAESPLIDFLSAQEIEVAQTEEELNIDSLLELSPEWIISYGYRHIIHKHVLDAFPGRIINLHISFLPWNRGADPNLWSFLEDSPKGVTIHLVDEGLDTGAIISQEKVDFKSLENQTLTTTYAHLHQKLQRLFEKTWPELCDNQICPVAQSNEFGTAHKLKDKESFLHLLDLGWDTLVSKLIGKGQ